MGRLSEQNEYKPPGIILTFKMRGQIEIHLDRGREEGGEGEREIEEERMRERERERERKRK